MTITKSRGHSETRAWWQPGRSRSAAGDRRRVRGIRSGAANLFGLLDKIASAGDSLRQGVANYGEGADYADSVINAATAIAGIAGGGSYTDLANAAANPDTASQIMQALATVTHGK